MRSTLLIVSLLLVGCNGWFSAPSPPPDPPEVLPAEPAVPDLDEPDEPVAAPPPDPHAPPVFHPAGESTPTWLLWSDGPDQVQVLGTWADGPWVSGWDGPPSPGPSPVTTLEGEPLGALTGAARTRCGQSLMKVAGPLEANEALLVSPLPARPRPVVDAEPTRADRSLPGTLWPGTADLEPKRVVVADLDGDGVDERIVHIDETDDDGVPQHSALVVRSGTATPVFTGWPSPTGRPDLHEAGVPDEAHYVSWEGVADVNGDGTMELVAVHHMMGAHFHGLVVYTFHEGQLIPIGDFRWVERDCYAPTAWSEE